MQDPALRVLVLALLRDDAVRMRSLLERLHIPCTVCADVEQLCKEVSAGAAALLITEESLDDPGVLEFKAMMAVQPSWSSLPVILLTNETAHARPRTLRMLGSSSAITFLERPVRLMTLMSAIRAAVHARRNQYEVRDLIAKLGDAVRQRDEFLAMLNHELRNPLAAVQYATDILQHIAADDPLLGRAREILNRQVTHVTTLLDELLDVERVTSGRIQLNRRLLDVRTVVEEALVAIDAERRRRGHSVHLDLPGAAVNVLGDPIRLRQILAELLENAVRYTPHGGTIRVRVRAEAVAEVFVSDSGIGMEPGILARAFDLFAQGDRSLDRAEGGLGVGLTLASRLALMHGGKLEAFSPGPGKGTTLKLELPLVRSLVARSAAGNGRAQELAGRDGSLPPDSSAHKA